MVSHGSTLPMRRFRMRQHGTVAYHPPIRGEICVDLHIVKQRATIKLVWKINKSMTNLDWHLSLLSCENTILSSNIASGSSRNICVKKLKLKVDENIYIMNPEYLYNCILSINAMVSYIALYNTKVMTVLPFLDSNLCYSWLYNILYTLWKKPCVKVCESFLKPTRIIN